MLFHVLVRTSTGTSENVRYGRERRKASHLGAIGYVLYKGKEEDSSWRTQQEESMAYHSRGSMDQLLPPGKPGKDEANISLGKGQQALSFIEGKEGIVVMCTIATLLLLGVLVGAMMIPPEGELEAQPQRNNPSQEPAGAVTEGGARSRVERHPRTTAFLRTTLGPEESPDTGGQPSRRNEQEDTTTESDADLPTTK